MDASNAELINPCLGCSLKIPNAMQYEYGRKRELMNKGLRNLDNCCADDQLAQDCSVPFLHIADAVAEELDLVRMRSVPYPPS
jgi:hypothetical protein